MTSVWVDTPHPISLLMVLYPASPTLFPAEGKRWLCIQRLSVTHSVSYLAVSPQASIPA